ncbi:MAG TPA: hypothetical protein VIK86_08065 [Candidatus Paceibacterota bacterium]
MAKKINSEEEDLQNNDVIKETLSIDEIVALRVAEVLAEKEQTSKSSNKYKFVPDSAIIVIKANGDGKFIIGDDRGQNFFVELNGYGDTNTISFKDLKSFHGRNSSIMKTGKVVPIEVLSDNADVTIDDVIRNLSLNSIYLDTNKISPIDVENLFTSKVKLNEFENKVKNSTEIVETILEVGYILYKQGVFTDNSKMNYLRQTSAQPQLFTH